MFEARFTALNTSLFEVPAYVFVGLGCTGGIKVCTGFVALGNAGDTGDAGDNGETGELSDAALGAAVCSVVSVFIALPQCLHTLPESSRFSPQWGQKPKSSSVCPGMRVPQYGQKVRFPPNDALSKS